MFANQKLPSLVTISSILIIHVQFREKLDASHSKGVKG